MNRVAELLQYLTLFLGAWFIASPDHPMAVAAGAGVSGVVSLAPVGAVRRGASADPPP